MCDPVTAAGLALSAGGTFLQSREEAKNQQRMMNAKNAAFTENMNRNTQYAADAGSIAANNVQKQGRENFDEQKEADAVKMEQLFNERRVQPDYNVGAAAGSLPKNVVLARQAASEEAAAKTDRDVGNNAALQSYGNTMFNTGLDQSAFARLFGGIQDKAGANTRMLPIEMNAAANNAQKAPSIFPTLMKAAGTGLSLFGSAGGSFTGTKAGTMAPGVYGPPVPLKSYGLFMDNKPVDLFGYQLAGRYS